MSRIHRTYKVSVQYKTKWAKLQKEGKKKVCFFLGKSLLAFVFVTDAKPSLGFDTAAALSGVTGLEELHKIAGDDCYLLKIRASGTDELNEIIEAEINPVQSVTRVRTTIVLSAVAERPCMAGHSI